MPLDKKTRLCLALLDLAWILATPVASLTHATCNLHWSPYQITGWRSCDLPCSLAQHTPHGHSPAGQRREGFDYSRLSLRLGRKGTSRRTDWGEISYEPGNTSSPTFSQVGIERWTDGQYLLTTIIPLTTWMIRLQVFDGDPQGSERSVKVAAASSVHDLLCPWKGFLFYYEKNPHSQQLYSGKAFDTHVSSVFPFLPTNDWFLTVLMIALAWWAARPWSSRPTQFMLIPLLANASGTSVSITFFFFSSNVYWSLSCLLHRGIYREFALGWRHSPSCRSGCTKRKI